MVDKPLEAFVFMGVMVIPLCHTIDNSISLAICGFTYFNELTFLVIELFLVSSSGGGDTVTK